MFFHTVTRLSSINLEAALLMGAKMIETLAL